MLTSFKKIYENGFIKYYKINNPIEKKACKTKFFLLESELLNTTFVIPNDVLMYKKNYLLYCIPNISKISTKYYSMFGIIQKIISQSLKSVSKGNSAQVRLKGIGYKSYIKNKTIYLRIGRTKYAYFSIPNYHIIRCIKVKRINI
jgi:ribosomal protein L6P/L9E